MSPRPAFKLSLSDEMGECRSETDIRMSGAEVDNAGWYTVLTSPTVNQHARAAPQCVQPTVADPCSPSARADSPPADECQIQTQTLSSPTQNQAVPRTVEIITARSAE
eukprot:907158-Pyramimonas_sp.AAC.1